MKIQKTLFKSKIIYLIIMVITISCKNEKRTLIGLFDSEETLQHIKIKINDNGYLSRTGRLYKDGDFLYISNDDGETYISLFDLRKQVFVKQIIRHGEGPNEMFYPPQSITVLDSNILSYYDPQMRALYHANYSQLDSIQIIRKLNLLKKGDFYSKLIPMAYGYYVGIGVMDKGMYAVLDKNGRILSYNYNFPKDEMEQVTNGQKFMAYQGGLIPNVGGTKFFFYSYASEILEILQIKKNGTLSKIKDIHFRKVKYEVQNNPDIVAAAIKGESIISFISAAATKKYIYLLYSGRALNSKEVSSNNSNTILVFDWEGNPVVKYNLDIDICEITVSEDDETVYAITITENDTELIKFDL